MLDALERAVVEPAAAGEDIGIHALSTIYVGQDHVQCVQLEQTGKRVLVEGQYEQSVQMIEC